MENQDKEIIDRFKDFAKDADSEFNGQIMGWREMRDFACGDQERSTFPSKETFAGRYKASANIIPRIVSTIVNPVRQNPYSIELVDKTFRQGDELQKAMTMWTHELFERSPFSVFQGESLRNGVSFGIGAFYAYTDLDDATGEAEVYVANIDDPTMLILDPSSTDITGADSEKLAFVQIISKDRAKREYGADASFNWEKPLVGNFGESWNVKSKNQIQLVTYFERTENGVSMYRMIGDKVVFSAELPISRIPVFLVKGTVDWNGQKQVLHGVAHMTKDLQVVINYAQSQLADRMLRAPKPTFSISREALEGNTDYYKNVDKNMMPLLVYNATDKNGNQLSAPARLDNSVQTDDIARILEVERDLAADITGVSRNLSTVQGLGDRETAEGLLLRTKSNEMDVSHYREHLKASVRELGKVLLEFFAFQKGVDSKELKRSVAVQVVKGPELVTSKQEARSQLIALSQIIPENMKPVIAFGVSNTLDNPEVNGISRMLFKLLPPEVLSDNPQVKQLQAQLAQVQQQASAELQKRDKQIMELNSQIHMLQLRSQADVTVAQINAQAKLQAEAMKNGTDVQRVQTKAEADLARASAEIQSRERVENAKIMANLAKFEAQQRPPEPPEGEPGMEPPPPPPEENLAQPQENNVYFEQMNGHYPEGEQPYGP